MTDGSGPVPGITLLEEIGRGGFASVHRAHQLSVDRLVAVKIDSRRLVEPADRRRFVREATAAGRLSSHPNILALYDCGTTDDGRPYLVMEYCPEGSYWSVVTRHGPRSPQEVATVGAGIADALVAAHGMGILHRDIKPANLLLSLYGTVLLADFGLATLPRPEPGHSVTLAALTPDFAPPEAFHHSDPTPAADIYSLGCTLYALLTGRSPRADGSGRSPSIPDLLAQHAMPLAPVAVPGSAALMDVIWRATAREPADRYSSAEELREALRSAAEHPGAPISAPQAVATSATGRSRSRSRMAAVTVAVVATALALAGAGWALLARSRGDEIVVALPPASAVQDASATPGTGQPSTSEPSAVPTSTAGPGRSATPEARSRTTSRTAPTTTSRTTPRPTSAPAAPTGGAACYAGLVNISGIQTARTLPCTQPHYWEAYARGTLSDATTGVELDTVLADPRVRAACSEAALRRYLGGAASDGYDREVLPPREAAFLAGSKGFVCLAARQGAGEVTGSLRSG